MVMEQGIELGQFSITFTLSAQTKRALFWSLSRPRGQILKVRVARAGKANVMENHFYSDFY